MKESLSAFFLTNTNCVPCYNIYIFVGALPGGFTRAARLAKAVKEGGTMSAANERAARRSISKAEQEFKHAGNLAHVVYPEVEYITYNVKKGAKLPFIEPHVDNNSVVTLIAMITDTSGFDGGKNCFEPGLYDARGRGGRLRDQRLLAELKKRRTEMSLSDLPSADAIPPPVLPMQWTPPAANRVGLLSEATAGE